MANITASVKKRIALGGTDYLYVGTLTPDTSYTTGGDTVQAPAAPALSLPEKVDFFECTSAGGYMARYNPETGKIVLYECAGAGAPLKEVAAAANLSAQTFQYVCIGC